MSSAGPHTLKSWLAGMMSRRFWHDGMSEGDTLPEHCGRPSGFKTNMSRFRSLPFFFCWNLLSITTYREEFPCSKAEGITHRSCALYHPEMASG